MYSKELSEKVIKLRQENKSIREIALLTGKTEAGIKAWLSKRKIFKAENKTTNIDKIPEIELAYIAGIIDGEGSIVISKLAPNKKKREINFRYQLYVKVVNTDKRLIELLAEKTGQCSYEDKSRKHENINKRNTFSIHWPVNISLYILEKIYPYLVIKKEQVDLALRFRKTFKEYGNVAIPDFILEEREACYQEMKKLHKREF